VKHGSLRSDGPVRTQGFSDATAREAAPKKSSPLRLADLDAPLRCSLSIGRTVRSRRPKTNFLTVVAAKREPLARGFGRDRAPSPAAVTAVSETASPAFIPLPHRVSDFASGRESYGHLEERDRSPDIADRNV
jgi:hypothetical protein